VTHAKAFGLVALRDSSGLGHFHKMPRLDSCQAEQLFLTEKLRQVLFRPLPDL
jgi:hypothetical protein